MAGSAAMSLVMYPLDEVWPDVVKKITAIRRRYPDAADWCEQDIYLAIKERRALMFHSEEDGSFAIVKVKKKNGEAVLFVWIACGVNGKREQNFNFLKQIARNAGASRIEMESPRRGFEKMSVWKPVITLYSAEV
jgi:hypothetical protein